jgi:oligosaccharide repeat unit polymerase
MSVVSILLNNRKYQKIINEPSFITEEKMTFLKGNTQWLILLLITAIGVLGIIKYILDYSSFVGEFGILLNIFSEDTGQLRTMAENVESAGIQLSYFSWLAAFIISTQIAAKKISAKWFFAIFILVLLNSIFLDRTRPVWILFTCSLCFFFIRYKLYSRKKIIYVISAVLSFFVSIFIAIGSLLGKGSGDGNLMNADLPMWMQPVLLYITSAYAYLGRLMYYDAPCNYLPERVLYPAQKFLAKIQLTDQPPNQVLEFFSVPILTNVGTFLEPFYQDGGRVFLILGILIHTILFDRIALFLMKRISIFSIISIATLCFINFIAFFVPKITSTSSWFIFLLCFILSVFDKKQRLVD